MNCVFNDYIAMNMIISRHERSIFCFSPSPVSRTT